LDWAAIVSARIRDAVLRMQAVRSRPANHDGTKVTKCTKLPDRIPNDEHPKQKHKNF
jgi:hypothetical protein